MQPMSDLLSSALDYARLGWWVIPLHEPTKDGCSCGKSDCHSIAKHPRTLRGQHDATQDEALIREWWTRWPTANIGIVGDKSGLVLIDIDPRAGGVETWARIANGTQIDAPTVATGGDPNGRHFYFADPGGQLPGKLGPGVDVKRRGYVVAPPSRHASGRRYEWLQQPQDEIPVLPRWVRPAPIVIEQTDNIKAACEKIFDKWVTSVLNAREGDRNNSLNRAAFVLGGIVEHGKISEGQIVDALFYAARRVGLDENEARRTIASGLKSGKAKPLALDQDHPLQFADLSEHPPDEPPQDTVDPWGAPYTLLDAHAPRPPVVYIVDGVFCEASVNVVYGDSGSLKSMLLADLCAAVTGGQTWVGKPTIARPIMWLDFDNGARRSHERFSAFARQRGLPDNSPFFYYSMPTPTLEANNSSHMALLYSRVVNHQVGVLVVDNLGLVSGSADENSADMAAVIGGFRWLAEMTNVCVIVVHHQSKPSGYGKSKGDMLRGHSSIKAGLDVALWINREMAGDTPLSDIAIIPTKARDADIPQFAARFVYSSGQRQRGELDTATFLPLDLQAEKIKAHDEREDKINSAMDERVMDWLAENEYGTANGIAAALFPSASGKATGTAFEAVKNSIERLRRSGSVTLRDDVRQRGGGVFYSAKGKSSKSS